MNWRQDVKIEYVAVAALCIAATSCDREIQQVATEYQKRLPAMEQAGVVAGPGEQTFEENQNVRLNLPMPEGKFLELLKRLNLTYDLQGIIPTPWHTETLDLSKMQKAYQIYGKVDHGRRFAEIYRAYVDQAGQVVYVENMFAYPEP